MLLFETQLVELETCEISYAYLKSSSCGNFLKLNWGKRSQSRVNFSNDHGQLHNYTLTWGGGGGGGQWHKMETFSMENMEKPFI